MAELVEEAPGRAGVIEERVPRARPRMSWGSILGGVVSAIGVGILLYALGTAVGLSKLDPLNPRSLRWSGIFTGIWGLLTPLVALFVGGFVAARWSSAATRPEGAAHGLVVWGLASLVGAYLVVTALSAVIGGVSAVGHVAAQSSGDGPGGPSASADDGSGGQTVTIDADEALRPINERLQAQGRPPVTPSDLAAAATDAAQEAARTGERLDRDMLVNALAHNTGVSRADAQEIADRLEAQWEQTQNQLQGGGMGSAQDPRVDMLRAAHASSKAVWGVFGALLLGLIAALIGGALGVPNLVTRRLERIRVERPAPTPLAPREVYP